jgi:hypothetical protein
MQSTIQAIQDAARRMRGVSIWLSTEKISVRATLPRLDPIRSIPFRVQKALEVRQKLELSNRLEGLHINQWIWAGRGDSAISLAKALGLDWWY